MGCGIADFGFQFCTQGPWLAAPWDLDAIYGVEVQAAASQRSGRRESRSHVAPRVKIPGDKIETHIFLVWGVYRPLRPKSAIAHPITIQNIRYER